MKYSDVNYMESGVDITIKGAKHDKTELSGNRTNIANGESIKMEDFKHDEETDDVYTMTAVIKTKPEMKRKELCLSQPFRIKLYFL